MEPGKCKNLKIERVNSKYSENYPKGVIIKILLIRGVNNKYFATSTSLLASRIVSITLSSK